MYAVNWNGKRCTAATSRGGVLALADYCDNLMTGNHAVWPPSAIVQKLYMSNQHKSFDDDALATLTMKLGHYCDLQSINSEDAITWGFFGTLAAESMESRAVVLNWLCSRMGLGGANTQCCIDLFRRIPHPDTLVSGGPELDAVLIGDRSVVLVEAKWLSGEGILQGRNKDKTQLQLRREFLAGVGRRLFGDKELAVLGLARHTNGFRRIPEDSDSVVTGILTWDDLRLCDEHPLIGEFNRYLDWKDLHSRKR